MPFLLPGVTVPQFPLSAWLRPSPQNPVQLPKSHGDTRWNLSTPLGFPAPEHPPSPGLPTVWPGLNPDHRSLQGRDHGHSHLCAPGAHHRAWHGGMTVSCIVGIGQNSSKYIGKARVHLNRAGELTLALVWQELWAQWEGHSPGHPPLRVRMLCCHPLGACT